MNDAKQAKRARTGRCRESSSGFVVVLMLAVLAILLSAVWTISAQDGSDAAAASEQQLGMLQFIGDGQIRLELHDPAGNVVSRDTNQIDGATYTDDDDHVVIEIPHRLVGDYQLHVDADGSANRVHTFDVSVTDGVQTIQLAEKVLIVNVPTDPYVIRSTEEGFEDVTGTTQQSTSSTSTQSSSSSSSFIWIVVGAALVLIAIVAVIFIVRSRKRRT